MKQEQRIARYREAVAVLPVRLRKPALALPEEQQSRAEELHLRAGQQLTVLLPETLLEELTVCVVSAEVDVEAVAADRVEFTSVSGHVQADLRRALQVKADSVSGRVNLCFGSAPEAIDVDSVSGDVTLALPRSSGFTAGVDSVSGSVRGDFPMESLGKGRYVGGNGECDIDVDTVSGSVRFDTAE